MNYKLAYIGPVSPGVFAPEPGWRIHTVFKLTGNFASGVQLYALLEKLPTQKSKADDMKEALDSFENEAFPR